MARRYLARPLPPEGPASLTGDAARHLGTVMRVKAGEDVMLFDGAGRQARGMIRGVARNRVDLEVGPAQLVTREPARTVELAVALPAKGRAEWLFEHATEVGVQAFRPLVVARGTPGSVKAMDKLDRWERIVAAAAGQCDRSHLPRILPPASLTDTLADPDLPTERYMAEAGGQHAAPSTEPTVAFVGPPGGWTPEEKELLQDAGVVPLGLGELTLRTETAALVAAAQLLLS